MAIWWCVAIALLWGAPFAKAFASALPDNFPQTADEYVDPSPPRGALEVTLNARLSRKGDRWDVAGTTQADQCLPGTAVLVSDLCVMGHLTKDATILASFILDHTRGVGAATVEKDDAPLDTKDSRVDPKTLPPLRAVIFSNLCMAPKFVRGSKVDKRTALFHDVLQHWFLAAMSTANINDTAQASMRTTGMVREAFSVAVAQHPLDSRSLPDGSHPVADTLDVWFVPDLEAMQAKRGHLCYEAVVKRGTERWRWFRTRSHGYWFRRQLWAYLGIPARDVMEKDDEIDVYGVNSEETVDEAIRTLLANSAAVSQKQCTLGVTVLVRDEDRHFREAAVVDALRRRFVEGDEPGVQCSRRSCSVRVSLVKFDKVRGSSKPPPLHPEQLRILAQDTDVLIAAHGAGLAAIVAMRPGTVVLELFPHNFRYHMYAELAAMVDVRYIPYESPVVEPPRCCSARGKDTLPSLKRPHDGNGIGARECKKCDVRIADDVMEDLVEDGLQTACLAATPASR